MIEGVAANETESRLDEVSLFEAEGNAAAGGGPTVKNLLGKELGRILLVEDHHPTRQALEQLLVRRKYRVRSAGTAAEARAIARQELFDLLISDIGLPDGSGYELMKELKARYGLMGISLTGYGMEEDVLKSRAAGFVQHLTKPVRMQLLDEALAAARTRASGN
jgi:CheY-like chemotaxis protein